MAASGDSVMIEWHIEDCVFPEPGYYLVELYCKDQFVDDQVIRVIEG
jgi:hypothetical protein